MLIKRFEDIDVWKESRRLVNMIYNLTQKSLFKKGFGLKEQIQKAAVSCMSNVAEGFDSDTKRENSSLFKCFLMRNGQLLMFSRSFMRPWIEVV